ncbi:hypothetical protein [Brucella sp. NBRC 12950]|uniref:hypothetical protein n=1 Tax=Brucella sp. NBRC 12950 TaxID=2994518 RepID=UPI0024A27560|nr:hypothetical protein [Brucella sp. NBRC 12950]GLU26193.1 hypothetical protein Brsp01_14260 [Brucella sp. NBRC 12950]
MIGAALSRWTLSYFAASLSFLIIGVGMMAGGFGFPFHGIRAPETLILVHIIAIGWLALLMSGALLQFVPVLVAKPLWGSSAQLPALMLLLAGLIGLLLGFAGMAGLLEDTIALLPISGLLLMAGFSLIVLMLGVTIWKARPISIPTRFVAVGISCLLIVASLGGLYTFVLSGAAEQIMALEIAGSTVSIHAALALGGWMTFTAMGVSYRLLTMFMLSPDSNTKRTRFLWWLGVTALTTLGLSVTVFAFGIGQPAIVLSIALVPAIACIALYALDVRAIYLQRKRKAIELNSMASISAFAALLISMVLALTMLSTGVTDQMVAALVYLFVFGWLSGLSLAQLYKIVPFLTWLECYGPVMGRVQTPRVQDLVREENARHWFILYYGSVWFCTLALIFNHLTIFRLSSGLSLIAILALSVHFFRARRLLDVPTNLRLPNGVILPNLIHAGAPVLKARRVLSQPGDTL